MSKSIYKGKWTFSSYTGNGSKRFGPELWFNDQRVGFDLYIWTWNLTIMREHH